MQLFVHSESEGLHALTHVTRLLQELSPMQAEILSQQQLPSHSLQMSVVMEEHWELTTPHERCVLVVPPVPDVPTGLEVPPVPEVQLSIAVPVGLPAASLPVALSTLHCLPRPPSKASHSPETQASPSPHVPLALQGQSSLPVGQSRLHPPQTLAIQAVPSTRSRNAEVWQPLNTPTSVHPSKAPRPPTERYGPRSERHQVR
jgi:hypothetical protein